MFRPGRQLLIVAVIGSIGVIPFADAGPTAPRTGASVRASPSDVPALLPLWPEGVRAASDGGDRSQFEQMKPGPETRRLDVLVGDWMLTTACVIQGQRHHVQTETTYQWAPGRVWLRGSVQVTGFGPGVHYGWSQLTYDSERHAYVMVWIDNQSARVSISRGSWQDPDALVLDGVDESNGRRVHRRQVFRVLSSERIEWEFLTSDDGLTYARRAFGHHVRKDSGSNSALPRER